MKRPLTLDDLTPEDRERLEEVRRTDNLSLMSERYFSSPQGFTRWYFDGESVGHFRHLFGYHDLQTKWLALNKPEEFKEGDFEICVEPDPQELTIPSFYLKHGYIFFDWAKPFVSKHTNVSMAIAASGLGKTSAIGIASLCYSLLYPGFKMFNLGPSEKQAQLMAGEIDTWLAESDFQEFLELTPSGKFHTTRPSHIYRIRSPYGPLYPSLIECRTVGQDAENIVGFQGDWLNLEEFILIANLGATIPRIITRMRAMRPDGSPRWVKLTMIANPGDSAEKEQVEKRIRAIQLAEDPEVTAVIIKEVPSSANLYNTKRQLKVQRAMMDDVDAAMWLMGDSDAAIGQRELPISLLETCQSEEMDLHIRDEGRHESRKKGSVGLVHYRIPPEPNHVYVAIGDPGMSDMDRFSTLNVPVATVLDITDFPDKPARLVALDIIDGDGKYDPWLICFKDHMIGYRCRGWYDATNVRTAFQDENGSLKGWPATPLFFDAGNKPWSLTIFKRLMENGLFEWPYIEALWYQARVFIATGLKSKKNQDDVIASFLVFSLMLLDEQVLWIKLNKRFRWDRKNDEKVKPTDLDQPNTGMGRYNRSRPRYRRT